MYHIDCGPGCKICKPGGLSRCSEEEKYGMDTDLFNKGQLLDLEKDDIGKEKDAENMELEGIDVAT